jgi:hypothetical protein
MVWTSPEHMDHPKDHEKDDAAQSTHAVWLLLREPA